MPDLRAILDCNLGLAADTYLRDNVGDDGSVPTAGGISSSPDVIVWPAAAPDPTAAFGEGSGTENSAMLGFEVEAGQDNFICVRVKNRGCTAATVATVQVFWSPVTTLVTPAGATHVAIAISPDGTLINARVIRSSGSKALDDAALVSVRNATLPAPPPDAAATYDLGISFTLTDK